MDDTRTGSLSLAEASSRAGNGDRRWFWAQTVNDPRAAAEPRPFRDVSHGLLGTGAVKSWRRAFYRQLCGRCNEPIESGAPVLIVQLTGMARQLLRCVVCAGPAPPDLPELVEQMAATQAPMVPLKHVARPLAFDWKRAQAGEREPGIEG